MSSNQELNQQQDAEYTQYRRSLVARAAGSIVEQDSLSVEPDMESVVEQVIAVHRWVVDLENDQLDNFRGGSLERRDVPIPRPPSGALTAYILRRLDLID